MHLAMLDLVPKNDRATASLGFVVAAVATAHAVQFGLGTMTPDALAWLVVALVAAPLGVVVPANDGLERLARRLLPWAVGAGLWIQIGDLITKSPAIYLHAEGPTPLEPFMIRVALLALGAGLALASHGRSGRAAMVVLLAGYVLAGAWVVRTSPAPWIDVFVFQRNSADALLHGHNPYAITFPNIYGGGAYYGPGMVEGGRLAFGFVYMPLSLLLVLPAYAFGDDVRWAQLVFVCIAALSLVLGKRRGVLALGAAALLLTAPRGFFVLEQSWTEPLIVGLLGLVVLAARTSRRALPFALGLLLASKQYAVLFVPAALMFVDRQDLRGSARLLLKACGVAAVITLPFFMWGPHAFWHSVVELQFYQPFRDDALSILVWYKQTHGGVQPPVWIAFAAALVGAVLALVRLPRTPAGFAGAVALTFLPFIAFNKQAFCNYYFLVSGAFVLAAGAARPLLGRD